MIEEKKFLVRGELLQVLDSQIFAFSDVLQGLGVGTYQDQLSKLREELSEAEEDEHEIVDVLVVALVAARFAGMGVYEALRLASDKMDKNLLRDWEVEDGVAHHID